MDQSTEELWCGDLWLVRYLDGSLVFHRIMRWVKDNGFFRQLRVWATYNSEVIFLLPAHQVVEGIYRYEKPFRSGGWTIYMKMEIAEFTI